jgi:hypothetical protein
MRGLLLLGACLMVQMASAEPVTTGAFRATRTFVFVPGSGPTTAAVELSYPAQSQSEPGQYAQWPLTALSPAADAALVFDWADSFTGPTAGYHFLQVLLGDQVLWEQDVASGDAQFHRVEVALPVASQPAAGRPLGLSLRLLEKKLVTNYPVRVQVANPTLRVGARETALLDRTALPPAAPWPPEPPLPCLPVVGDWIWQASIVQPWGTTQTTAIKQAEEWAPRFAREHGINAMIVLPPEAHNAITGAHDKPDSPHHISDAEFRRALAIYRREGIRLILYSSIMHMGHAPQWQFGELAKSYPEWQMRDPLGDTVRMYGQPWLCPSTGALRATLDYTRDLVRAYDADAVMLDNNEFMRSESRRWTCTCESCRTKFRQYLQTRFGERIPGTKVATATATIPEQDTDPLWGLWLSFRNRTWAEACEAYRRELRQVKPDLVLLANTQYLYASGLLAVDGQYPHLDAVLSESRGYTPLKMAAKMLLGRALAAGRPLWNYIGTFDEKDYRRLRPPEEVAGVCAASTAVGTNPWIVFYGFTGEENQPSLAVLRRYNDFWHANAELLGASDLAGEVGVLVSTESRDLCDTGLLSPELEALLRDGVPLRPLRDADSLTAARLRGLRVLLATANPCLREATARLLADWVRAGGTLLVTSDAGWRDEAGRWRAQSALHEALGSSVLTVGSHACENGRVICAADGAGVLPAVQPFVVSPVTATTPVGVFGHTGRDGRRALALLGLEGEIGEVTVKLPPDAKSIELRLPGRAPQALTPAPGLTCRIPERLGLIVY